jgi:hypothetical protein
MGLPAESKGASVISNTIKAIGATCTIVAALAVVAVPTASAKHGNGRGVRVAGICDNGSTSKLKVKRDDGRLKFEFEVDQNLAGVVWDVTVTNDKVVVFDGQRITRDPSGSFSVERRIKGAKAGTIVATATRESGETCTATLTIPAKTPVVKDPTKPVTDPTKPVTNDPTTVGHDVNDDNGNDPAAHDANEDNHGNSGPGKGGGEDDSGHHGNDD